MFEDALVRQIKYALKRCDGAFEIRKTMGRIFVEAQSAFDFDETVEQLRRVFGIWGICPVIYVEDQGWEKLCGEVVAYLGEMYPDKNRTFKVNARRSRKNYPKDSMEINRDLGEVILGAFPEMRVDVHRPDILLNIEVREKIYVYSETIPGPGGMPVGTGGKAMVAEGAMDGVDGCFGVHVWADVPSGKVSVEAGPRMAACDMFKIYVTGKSCHGAQPHQGIDPVVVSSQLVNAFQTIVSREIDPTQPAVVTVGEISAGTSWNIVPESGFLQGTTRCFDADVRRHLEESVKRMVKSVGETYRAEIKLDWTPIVAPVVNHPEISALAAEAARKVMGPDPLYLYDKTNGGEDMSCYMEKAPGALAFLGVGCEACGAIWPQHNAKFQVDESALINGVKLCAQVAMDFNAQ